MFDATADAWVGLVGSLSTGLGMVSELLNVVLTGVLVYLYAEMRETQDQLAETQTTQTDIQRTQTEIMERQQEVVKGESLPLLDVELRDVVSRNDSHHLSLRVNNVGTGIAKQTELITRVYVHEDELTDHVDEVDLGAHFADSPERKFLQGVTIREWMYSVGVHPLRPSPDSVDVSRFHPEGAPEDVYGRVDYAASHTSSGRGERIDLPTLCHRFAGLGFTEVVVQFELLYTDMSGARHYEFVRAGLLDPATIGSMEDVYQNLGKQGVLHDEIERMLGMREV